MIRYSVLLSIFFLFSCQKPPCGYSKADLLETMSEMSEKIKDKDDLSKNEMKVLDEKVEQLVEECYKNYEDDLTKRESRAFWSDVSSYYFRRHGLAALGRIDKDIDRMAEALNENLESWMETSAERFEAWIEKFEEEDLNDIKIDLEGDFEKLGEKLEELLEKHLPEEER